MTSNFRKKIKRKGSAGVALAYLLQNFLKLVVIWDMGCLKYTTFAENKFFNFLTFRMLQSVSRRHKGRFGLHFEILRLELSTHVATLT
jgi:hypothetical protein